MVGWDKDEVCSIDDGVRVEPVQSAYRLLCELLIGEAVAFGEDAEEDILEVLLLSECAENGQSGQNDPFVRMSATMTSRMHPPSASRLIV